MEKNSETKYKLHEDIADITHFMEQFALLLKAETQALRAAKFEEAKQMQPQKQEMARQYQKRIQRLADRKDEIAKMPETDKENLVTARLKFSEILAENLRVIEAARKTGRRLVEKIISSARDAVSQKTGYGATGKMHSSADSRQSPVSIRLNDTF
ncbi:MAG: hypothetical protein EP349_05915 [Alphaproteobacteria bacterium]|nr:MAG: hypothetical protein EP349_05915 [Alphaproteobacteria bacterium]